MREVTRIERILDLLKEIWSHMPDVRFNQLVSNLQSMYSQQHSEYGRHTAYRKDTYNNITSEYEVVYYDFFYLEDDAFEVFLEQYLQELKK